MNENQNSPYEYQGDEAPKNPRFKAAAIAATGFLVFGGLIGGGAFAASQANLGTETPNISASASASSSTEDPNASPTPDATVLPVAPTTFTGDEEGDDNQDESTEQGEEGSHQSGNDSESHKGDSPHSQSGHEDSGAESENGSDD